jgi:hypothetical protein
MIPRDSGVTAPNRNADWTTRIPFQKRPRKRPLPFWARDRGRVSLTLCLPDRRGAPVRVATERNQLMSATLDHALVTELGGKVSGSVLGRQDVTDPCPANNSATSNVVVK